MLNTIKHIADMKAAIWINVFFYYLKRLWIIGRHIPDSLYGNYALKQGLSVLAVFAQQVKELVCKALYVFVAACVPVILLQSEGQPVQGFAVAVHILFFLSCIIGPFADSHIFSVTRDKLAYLRYMRMDARRYIQAALLYRYVPFFVYYLPVLLAAALFLRAPLWQGAGLWLVLIAFRMLGEAVQLVVFDRTGKVLSRSVAYTSILVILGAAAAYLPVFLGWGWHVSEVLLHPAGLAACAVLGGACAYYIGFGYKGYSKKLPRAMDPGFLASSRMRISSSQASVKGVEIREKDARISQTEKMQYQHRKGVAYFNALFFARHRRQLLRPVYIRLIIVAAAFAAGVAAYLSLPAEVGPIGRDLTRILPMFVFFMYFMTVADKACRAMFYNCDKDMLHYAYYRQPQMILQNFQARLVRVALYDGIIAGAVCVLGVVFCLVCGGNPFTFHMLLFCVTILLLSVLFTVHHLCLYYLFQPYSASLRVKNPFFTVINIAVYVLCYVCLQIEVGSVAFTVGVLGFTIAYIVAALILVYVRSPKTFRVK